MASIEDIKKLLESKSFASARDLDELEEKPDDKQNEVRLNCEPMVGVMEEEGKIFLNSVRFSGRRKSGSFNIRDINGGNQRNVTYKKLKLSIGKRFMIQKEMN